LATSASEWFGEVEIGSDVEPASRAHEFAALDKLSENLTGNLQPIQVTRSDDPRPCEVEYG
jgi:hypothetical protein